MTGYILVVATDNNEMARKVNELLQQGWQIHGETQAAVKEPWGHFKKCGEYMVYSQAMVKHG